MNRKLTQLASGLALAALVSVPALAASPSAAAQPVKIGMLTTLSGGSGYLGQNIVNGFKLAIDQGHGKLGGIPVTLIVRDDGLNPAQARQIVQHMISVDHVDLMTGVVFSPIALATVPMVTHHDMVYISPNTGDKQLLGKHCNANFFDVAFENDNPHGAMGEYLTQQHVNDVYLLAPNFPGGKTALAGFKEYYKGKIAGIDYTKLGQTNYATALAKVQAAHPKAVYFFYPGGMAINFLKQWNQAGLNGEIKLYGSGYSFDNLLVQTIGKPALGKLNTANWSADIKNPANLQFVKAYESKYHKQPTMYAAHGYDDARLIGSALEAVHGHVKGNTKAFRQAIDAANFKSVRGDFSFASNHAPVQAFYLRKVVKGDNGQLTNVIVKTIFEHHTGSYPALCHMQK